MGEWREVAERLVGVDLAIEDLDAWASEPEDVAELQHLEDLREELLTAVARRRISRGLRERLHDGWRYTLTGTMIDPRD